MTVLMIYISDEMDSYMYQTVGHDAIHYYAECMDLPLYRREIQGTPLNQEYEYEVTTKDETEDLFMLLQEVLVRGTLLPTKVMKLSY